MQRKSRHKNSNKTFFGFLILFCFLSIVASTQTKTDTISRITIPDSLYIKKYKTSIGLTTGWSLRNFELILGYPQSIYIKLSPNNVEQINFDFSYKFISFNYNYTAPFLNNTNSLKGSTSRKSFGFLLKLKAFDFRFDHARTKGFYMTNTKDFDATWIKSKPYIQFPDLINEQTGFSLAYNFNKKYSMASLTGGIEQQLKNCISFVPAFYAYYFRLHENFIDSSSLSKNMDYLKDLDFNLVLPMAATLVLNKNFYLSAIVGPSIGVDGYKANNVTLSSSSGYSKTVFSTGYLMRSGVGYTGNKWYFGAEAILRRYANHTSSEEKIIKKFYGVQFYIGMRVNPPRIIKKTVNWVEKESPVKL
jgi:hypothetical protein